MDCLEPPWMLPRTGCWCRCQHSTWKPSGVPPRRQQGLLTHVPKSSCSALWRHWDPLLWLTQMTKTAVYFFNYWLEQLMLPFRAANAAFWRLCFYCRGLCCDWVRALHLWTPSEVWPICLSVHANTLGILGSRWRSGGSRVLVVSQETEIRRHGPETAAVLGRIGLYVMFPGGQRIFDPRCFSSPLGEWKAEKRLCIIRPGFVFRFYSWGKLVSLSLGWLPRAKDEGFLLRRVVAAVKWEKC